jgi:glycosyltransferase involved in cell wall biosynthesis
MGDAGLSAIGRDPGGQAQSSLPAMPEPFFSALVTPGDPVSDRGKTFDDAVQRTAESRLRVLYLINRVRDQGGAERFALGLARSVPRSRIEPWMCFTRGASEEAIRSLQAAGVPVVNIGRHGRWDSYRLMALLRLMRQKRFDVVHAHMFGSNLWGAVFGRLANVPVVIAHEHSWSYQGDPVRAWLDRHVIGRLVTRFIAVSGADAQRMVTYEHIPEGRVLVMPTAYVPSEATRGDIRAELGIDYRAPLIAIASVLRPPKTIEVLLEAHTLVLERVPAAHLVIAGDGPLRASLEERARELAIDHCVHFLGVRHDVDSILKEADVAALSSDREGMPLFVFECMANRIPLVATAVGGLREVIDDGLSGVLVPPRDPHALAEALAALLNDPDRRARLSTTARGRLERFTIDSVAARFADLYEDLVLEARR